MTLDREVRSPRRGPAAQVVLGLMVVAVGVLFTLDNLEILDARDYLQYWPIVFVVVGLLKIWQGTRDGHGWAGGLIFVALGAWMLINRILYFVFDARQVFPLLLVFMGGYMVWRGFGGRRRRSTGDGHSSFSALAIMSGVARRSTSQTFEGADLTAVMGGCEIDLRQASIAPGTEAIIDVFAFWGGIDIKVPEDWVVITKAVPIMGGIEDKSRVPQPLSTKRLIIRGIVVMGGIVVKNSAVREDRD
jgi:predicted membrane protein